MAYAKDARIAIIGAGAAGLTAADTLTRRGYTNVTVFERGNRVGGKCHSITHEGQIYELGAGVIASGSLHIRELAERYHVPIQRIDFSARMSLDAETGKPEMRTAAETHRLVLEVGRYYRIARKYRRLLEPGFANTPPELAMPFDAFAKAHRIEALAAEFAKYFTGFGYGFFEEVPTAYVIKYYPWNVVFAYFQRAFYKFPNGFQSLWEVVAAAHTVRLGSSIEAIKRDERIALRTADGEETFDALIIASPLDESLRYLDADPEEQRLFRKIRHYDYRTYGCRVKNFPKTAGYIPKHLTSTKLGHPVFWYQRFTDSDLYTFYTFGDWKMTDTETETHIRNTVEQLGGTLEEIVLVERWKYFPHVSPADFRDGYFDRLEALQGQRHTFYAGELLNFSSVAHTSDYARNLIERFF